MLNRQLGKWVWSSGEVSGGDIKLFLEYRWHLKSQGGRNNQENEYREEPNNKPWDTPTLRELVEEEGW